MVEPTEGRSGGGSGIGWATAATSATTAAASSSPSSYAAANLSPLPAAKIGVGGGSPAAASNYHQYPTPLAKYEDVVANRKLFMDTLEKLHALMRTKFMIPIIGGKELDLHQLFVEVTSRGGIEKILREKKWKEVTAVFNFPSTATNASFVLRKYYYSLLQHYEQIYYFKAQGWTPLPAGSLHSPSSVVPIAVHGVVSPPPLPHQPNSATPQHSTTTTTNPNPTLTPTAAPPPPASSSPSSPVVGCPVVGVIDGKFESGYLVTVTIGTEKLKGVLYQSPPSNSIHHHHNQQSSVLNPTKNNNSSNNNNSIHTNNPTPAALGVQVQPRKRRRRRKKSEIRRRDPAHPKPNRSGYNFFFAEQHARLKPLYPGKDREISRMIGELWTNLKDNDKSVYQEKAMEDKERYRLEMEGYRERLRTGQVISNAVPIRQRVPDLDVNMVEVDVEEDTGIKDSAAEIDDQSSESSESMEDEEEEEDEGAAAAAETDTVEAGVEKDGGSRDNDDSTNNTDTATAAAEKMSNVVIGAVVAETKVDDSGGNQKQQDCVVNNIAASTEASQEGAGGGGNIAPAPPEEGKQNIAPAPPEGGKQNNADSEKEKPPVSAMT